MIKTVIQINMPRFAQTQASKRRVALLRPFFCFDNSTVLCNKQNENLKMKSLLHFLQRFETYNMWDWVFIWNCGRFCLQVFFGYYIAYSLFHILLIKTNYYPLDWAFLIFFSILFKLKIPHNWFWPRWYKINYNCEILYWFESSCS